jgi:hypothetical protein
MTRERKDVLILIVIASLVVIVLFALKYYTARADEPRDRFGDIPKAARPKEGSRQAMSGGERRAGDPVRPTRAVYRYSASGEILTNHYGDKSSIGARFIRTVRRPQTACDLCMRQCRSEET